MKTTVTTNPPPKQFSPVTVSTTFETQAELDNYCRLIRSDDLRDYLNQNRARHLTGLLADQSLQLAAFSNVSGSRDLAMNA